MKQSIPFFGISRRGLLSTLAVLPALSGNAPCRLRAGSDRTAGRCAAARWPNELARPPHSQ